MDAFSARVKKGVGVNVTLRLRRWACGSCGDMHDRGPDGDFVDFLGERGRKEGTLKRFSVFKDTPCVDNSYF